MRKRAGVIQLDVPRLLEALYLEQHRRKLMQAQVAAELGIDPSTIAQWRRGVGMSGDTALRVSLWLDRDLRQFARVPEDPLSAVRGAAA